tara:strand:- start:115 stop:1050 length:936 start_codon:yes stop_codon:yes gene_type:complete
LNQSKMKAIEYFRGLKNKDISILAQAITIIESNKDSDKEIANDLIDLCLKEKTKSKVICVSGPPGVGKSTFIDTLGSDLIDNNNIAVLAIDPTSKKSKGSIMADKTRMQKISSKPNVFIRPSPSGDALGGINKRTRESIILCKTFGFDIIFIETVGVGQSEITGHFICDCFILLCLPKSGDHIQAIKKGILEIADLIIINKIDTINNVEELKEKNNFSEKNMNGKIIETFSSHKPHNISSIWNKIKYCLENKKKKNKQIFWLKEAINEELIINIYKKKEFKKEFDRIVNKTNINDINVRKEAKKIVKKYLK